MKTLTVLLLAVACCGAALAGTLSLAPPASTVPLGSPVTLDVNITDVSGLYAYQFDINFNPAVLAATGVAEGVLFSSAGPTFFDPGTIDNAAGTITLIYDSLSGAVPGVGPNGTIATISFNAIGYGTSSVDLANVSLLDSELGDIEATLSGATVTVADSTTVPDPAPFGLLLAALAAIGLRVRHKPN